MSLTSRFTHIVSLPGDPIPFIQAKKASKWIAEKREYTGYYHSGCTEVNINASRFFLDHSDGITLMYDRNWPV